MIKRTMFAVAATVLLAIFVAGCGDDPDVAAAKKAQTLQTIALQMDQEATIMPLLTKVQTVGWVLMGSEATAICCILTMGAMRRVGLGAMSETERWEMLEMGRVKIAVAQAQAVAAQHPGDVTNNYGAAIDGEWRNVDEPLQIAAPPVAPSWAALQAAGFVATPEHFIVAYSSSGAETVDLNGNSSVAIIGRSGQGKTTAVRFYVKQAAQFGGGVVFDPHGAIIPHVGMPRVAHANSNNHGQMDDLAQKLDAELNARLDAYARGERTFTPITVFADELPTLSQMSAATVNVLGRVILEGRKVKMFIMLAGQGIPAAILEAASGGRRIAGSLYRDSFTVRVAFSASERMAGMVGFSGDETRLIDELGDQPGKCWIEGPMRMTFCAMPNISSSDLSGPPQLAAPAPIARYVPAEAIKEAIKPDEGNLNGYDVNLNGDFMALNGLNGYGNSEFNRALETVKASKNMRQAVAHWLDIAEDKAVGDTYTKGSQALWAALQTGGGDYDAQERTNRTRGH